MAITGHNLYVLTPADVSIAVKHHHSAEDLCLKYGCTRDQLTERLRNIYTPSSYADKMLKQLDNNEKFRQQHLRRRGKSARRTTSSTNTSNNSENTCNTPSTAPIQTVAPATFIPPEKLKSILIQEATNCQAAIGNLEKQHELLTDEHSQQLERLKALQSSIAQLQSDLQGKYRQYSKTLQHTKELVEQINSLSTQREERVAHLTELQHKISLQEKLIIYFFADGNVEITNRSDFHPDYTGDNAIYQELIKNPLCQDLRLREIHILAKALAVQQNTEHIIEPIFDNTELEVCFAQITAQAKEAPLPEEGAES